MRPSVKPITASTTSGTTRATSTSPSTTPMTMLTSTIAWCTPCVQRARRAHSSTLDVISHLIGSSSESFRNHLHGAPSLTLFSLSSSFCSSLSFSSTSSTSSCTLSSTTRSLWKACATPPTRRVRTPTTSPLPSQIQRTYYSMWFIGGVSRYNCEGSVKNPSIWKESLTWIVSRIRSVRGENLEG